MEGAWGFSTPSKAYTDSVPDENPLSSVGQHTFAFYARRVTPVGLKLFAFDVLTSSCTFFYKKQPELCQCLVVNVKLVVSSCWFPSWTGFRG